MSVQLTYCPPRPAHFIVEPQIAFADRRQHPVHVDFDADGAVSKSGIDFDSFSRMQTTKRKFGRDNVPLWTRNQVTVRAVLVAYFEQRAFGPVERRRSQNGTEAARLRRACERLRARVPQMLDVMDGLIAEYMLLYRSGVDPNRQRKLKVEIESLDTQIRMAQENAPAVILGILYQAYNVGQDSVGVGAMFGYKPPHIRMLLARLNKTWKQMQTEPPVPTVCGRLPKTSPERLEKSKAAAARWFANLTPEQKAARRSRVNVSSAAWMQEKLRDPRFRAMRNAANRAARAEAARERRKAVALARIEKLKAALSAPKVPVVSAALTAILIQSEVTCDPALQ